MLRGPRDGPDKEIWNESTKCRRIGARIDCLSWGKPPKNVPDQGPRESSKFLDLPPGIFAAIAKIPKVSLTWTRIPMLKGPRDDPGKEIRNESTKCLRIGARVDCFSWGNLPKMFAMKDPENRRNFLTSPQGFLPES